MRRANVIILMILDIYKAPTLWIKAQNNTNIKEHIMYIEIETVTNLTNG